MNLEHKTILITGIGGFIGMRTAELAIERGMKVVGLQRTAAKAEAARKLGAKVIIGSITNPVASKEACEGVDLVLHTAAIADEGASTSLQQYREINVNGAVNMAQAAKNAGVKAFVHLSSVMVYGFDYPNRVTENEPLVSQKNSYCQSKIESEQAILELNTPQDFGVIVIRPGDVYGARSIPWVVKPLKLMQQKAFMYADGGRGVMNHVYIDNLIDGILLAIEKEAYGEIFNITDGKETPWQEYYTRLAAIANFPAPSSLPASVLKLLLRLKGLPQTLKGQKPKIPPESIDFILRPYAYSIAKAQKYLGYQPKIDLTEGMKRTQTWLQQKDLLTSSVEKPTLSRVSEIYSGKIQ